jgi:hypothetical protein
MLVQPLHANNCKPDAGSTQPKRDLATTLPFMIGGGAWRRGQSPWPEVDDSISIGLRQCEGEQTMLEGCVDTAGRDRIAGWAADTDHPDAQVEIIVIVDKKEVGRVSACQPRTDLAAAKVYGRGDHGFVFHFDPSLALDRSYDVVVAFAAGGGALGRGKFRIHGAGAATGEAGAAVTFHRPIFKKDVWLSTPPRYVVHVGLPKTGTKYLQRVFWLLRDEMRRAGIYYPHEWWPTGPYFTHSGLFRELEVGPSERLEGIFAALNASGCATVLLSCEGFYGLPAESLKYFRDLISSTDVAIIVYLRRWSDRFPSAWQQSVKQGSSVTFPEAYARLISQTRLGGEVDYCLGLDKFAGIFGKDNIRIVSYSNLRDRGVDIAENFFGSVLQWVPQQIPEVGTVFHESMGLHMTELVRCLNYLEIRAHGKSGIQFYEKFRIALRKSRIGNELALLHDAMDRHLEEIAIDDGSDLFRDLFGRLNERYSENIVSSELGDQLFRPKSRNVQYVHPNFLLEEGVAATIRRIHLVLSADQNKELNWFQSSDRKGAESNSELEVARPVIVA